jgi:peroxiredoxin
MLAAALFLAVAHHQDPQSPEAAKPLAVGEMAPTNAQLLGPTRASTELSAALGGKPTVLVFYRGGWDSFSNLELAELNSSENQLSGLGFQIVAISPDAPQEIRKTIDKHHLSFQVYSDTRAVSLRRFGVAYHVDDGTFASLKAEKINLEAYSGERHHVLPVPSVFVVNAAGKITFVHTDPDDRNQMKGADIVAAAKAAGN